jgi:hypothetical protein
MDHTARYYIQVTSKRARLYIATVDATRLAAALASFFWMFFGKHQPLSHVFFILRSGKDAHSFSA